ncbi:MAG: Bifunctional glutamine synthetase adenylyltransferase/adenylyl-removing enzyme [Myxococcota bacterium]|nr:Bifunctional glutamine synthetase adenylyltransferase/adenylyl-removing enzyme [Myxococcota bacterium]
MDATAFELSHPDRRAFLDQRGLDHGIIELRRRGAPPALAAGLIAACAGSPDPDLALAGLLELSRATRRHNGFLARDPLRLWRLVWLCACSRYLPRALARQPLALAPLLSLRRLQPEQTREQYLSSAFRATARAESDEQFKFRIRRWAHREMARIAIRDVSGLAPVEVVTREISFVAIAACEAAVRHARAKLEESAGAAITRDGRRCGFCVLGMGKLGGRELNFSSDIDLLYLYETDDGVVDGAGHELSLHAWFDRLARRIGPLLSDITPEGFVFRVDLDLRPEGRGGPLTNSVDAALSYYENWGQTWEKVALLKAAPIAGDLETGHRFLREVSPFMLRRSLDYGLLQEIAEMKRKVDRAQARKNETGWNVKLGRGGIREAEFFCQALVLLNAGRNPSLREHSTLGQLRALFRAGLISSREAGDLTDAYVFYRRLEHRLQMMDQLQTHVLPTDPGELERLARRMAIEPTGGESPAALLLRRLTQHQERVHALFNSLHLAPEEIPGDMRVELLLEPGSSLEELEHWAHEAGMERPQSAAAALMELLRRPGLFLSPGSPAFDRSLSSLFWKELLDSPDPGDALACLPALFSHLKPRAQWARLLKSSPAAVRKLLNLLAAGARLTRMVVNHPELTETFVIETLGPARRERASMEEDLSSRLEQAADLEHELEILCRFRAEELLRIAMNEFSGALGLIEAQEELSQLADTAINGVWRIACREMERAWGAPAGPDGPASMCIFGLGKLGGRELTYASDLDLVFVYSSEGATAGGQRTSITNREYFSRLAQKFIHLMTTPTREGRLYDVDTRLRPSGNQGALVVSASSFLDYHRTRAQAWERQALLRLRFIAGDQGLWETLRDPLENLVYRGPLPASLKSDMFQLRMRAEKERGGVRGALNLKTGPGGLMDIEYIAQYLQLLHGADFPGARVTSVPEALRALTSGGFLPEDTGRSLHHAYVFLRTLESRLRIVYEGLESELPSGDAAYAKLARRMGYRDDGSAPPGARLRAALQDVMREVRGAWRKLFEE